MEDQILDIPATMSRRLRFAGFWIRFIASVIDSIIVGGINLMLASSFFSDYDAFNPHLEANILYVIVGMGYFCGMESSGSQATLGKLALGIKVGNSKGESISFPTALGRYVGKILSALILLIGFMMAGWNPKKQALHDKLAGTYVFYA